MVLYDSTKPGLNGLKFKNMYSEYKSKEVYS